MVQLLDYFKIFVTANTYNKVLVNDVVSFLDLMEVCLEAVLPTFEHRFLHAEVAKMLGSVSDENICLLLLLLHNLLPDIILMYVSLAGNVSSELLLAHQVDEIALLQRVNSLKFRLILDD